MIRWYFSIWSLLVTLLALGQANKTIIPFQLTPYNNISIKAILNQKDTIQLMFHTGATDVTIIESAIKRIKTLSFSKSIDSIKSWGGQTNQGRVSENNVLEIEGLKWEKVTITENKFSGQFTDGKFGLDLFKDKAVQIDFDKKSITLSDKLPKRHKGFEKHNITYDDGFMFINANCIIEKDSSVSHKFLIHSGYSGCLLLDDKFAEDNQLDKKLIITGEKELKDSYGNIIKSKKALLPALKLGKITFWDVPVGFFPGSLGKQKISVIGGDMLKRFNIIIDAKRQFIYLKANKNKKLKHTNI